MAVANYRRGTCGARFVAVVERVFVSDETRINRLIGTMARAVEKAIS